MRARDTDPIRIHAVERNGFTFLNVVPDGDLLRGERQFSFAREMVPACDGKQVPDAELARRTSEIELTRLEHDQWSEDDEVGAPFAKVLVKQPSAAGRLLEQVDGSSEDPSAGCATSPGKLDRWTRRPFAGTF